MGQASRNESVTKSIELACQGGCILCHDRHVGDFSFRLGISLTVVASTHSLRSSPRIRKPPPQLLVLKSHPLSSMPTEWIHFLNSYETRDQSITTTSVTVVVEIQIPLPPGLPAKILEAVEEWSLSHSAIQV